VWRVGAVAVVGIAISLIAGADSQASVTLTITGKNVSSEISLGSASVIAGTDTVLLNGRQLRRATDYTIEGRPPRLTLLHERPLETDTLTIVYTPWPSWITVTFGNPIPDASPAIHAIPQPPPESPLAGSNPVNALRFTGHKSFRVTTGPASSSAFGQSLDLSLSGELAPGVELTGAVSDRGYDPINGVANSRLDEFDRLYLRLKSTHLLAQIGDISLTGRQFDRPREVSGGSARVSFPTYAVEGTVARPRGQFKSVHLTGSDSYQGPYQPSNGLAAIVPGSDEVWLDGVRLERGANKDYVIDYATGRITFTAVHPIDSRSRIEIDFEPLSTQYRQELIAGGAGVASRDSSRQLSFWFSREGDDKGQSLISMTNDDISALGHTADTILARSGVVPDTAGDYRLLADSLPDTVWQYVGAPSGDHTVRFSFVGAGKGAYQFYGGDQYVFVGAGKGDYLPVILFAAPRRTETARLSGQLKSGSLGVIDADMRYSQSTRNLWSVNSASTDGTFHLLSWQKDWNWHGSPNSFRIRRQYQQADFVSTRRLDDPDLSRSFLLPSGLILGDTRSRHDAEVMLSPAKGLVITPSASRFELNHRFHATIYRVGAEGHPTNHLGFDAAWRELESRYNLSPLDGSGDARTLTLGSTYNRNRLTVHSDVEYDKRQNAYSSIPGGTKYVRSTTSLSQGKTSLRYEFYQEDSLIGAWTRSLTRHRLSASAQRNVGRFQVDGLVTRQWLDQPGNQDRSLLGRANLTFDDSRRRVSGLASYMISEEQRNERGFTYLQVDPGRGTYRLDNGRYIPDVFGDYIRLEEILSTVQRVRRGEKSFRFSKEGEQFVVRFNSTINEELLAAGRRTWWWVVPFVSDESQPYLYYQRTYEIEGRGFSVGSIYVLNVTAAEKVEKRMIVDQSRNRRDQRLRLALREPVQLWTLEQGIERFSSRRDIIYGDAGQSKGWRANVGVRRTIERGEATADASYRRSSGDSGESDLYALKLGGRLSVLGHGDLRFDTEMYRQALAGFTGVVSTVLTDNHEGTRGLTWTASVNYGLSGTVKVNVTLNGRYADTRPGQLFARSEVVAEF
jgi:hypothetical protein